MQTPISLVRVLVSFVFFAFLLPSCITWNGPMISWSKRLRGNFPIDYTVRIDKNLAMKATEVNVYNYMEFVAANGYDPSLFPEDNNLPYPAYKALLEYYKGSDHSKHRRIQAWDSIWHVYHDLPLNSPITGVSYEQAMRYCAWLEAITNAGRRPDRQIAISLPSIELYRRLIPTIDTLSSPRRCPLFNYNGASATTCKMHWNVPLLRVDAFWPNNEGVYGLRGNVAEMTATKGIAMGGSFRHYAYEASPDHQQLYTKPEDWLGFRYIVTLK